MSEIETISYKELEKDLDDLYKDNEEVINLNDPVYKMAVKVIGLLKEKNCPVPLIFVHGYLEYPKSVVFDWKIEDLNLYITISSESISTLISTPKSILNRTSFIDHISYLDSFIGAWTNMYRIFSNLKYYKWPTSIEVSYEKISLDWKDENNALLINVDKDDKYEYAYKEKNEWHSGVYLGLCSLMPPTDLYKYLSDYF